MWLFSNFKSGIRNQHIPVNAALIEISNANGILESYNQPPKISPKESVKLETEASKANAVPSTPSGHERADISNTPINAIMLKKLLTP